MEKGCREGTVGKICREWTEGKGMQKVSLEEKKEEKKAGMELCLKDVGRGLC